MLFLSLTIVIDRARVRCRLALFGLATLEECRVPLLQPRVLHIAFCRLPSNAPHFLPEGGDRIAVGH